MAKTPIIVPASWVRSPARCPWHPFSVALAKGLHTVGGVGSSPGRENPPEGVSAAWGAGGQPPLPDSLPHLPLPSKHFPPTNIIKFKTNITVKPSCQPWRNHCARGWWERLFALLGGLGGGAEHPARRDLCPAGDQYTLGTLQGLQMGQPRDPVGHGSPEA